MKSTIIIIVILLLSAYVSANGDHAHEIEEGKQLVESNVGCDGLNDEQLEAIGEYIMELTHPGEEHEMMDGMMGGEGSESLEQAHIQMARMRYCGQGMMGSAMMGSGAGANQGMMGSGMMGGYGSWGAFGLIWIAFRLLILLGVIALIYWLYKKATGKSTQESPVEILKKRYANGEITKEQFDGMKKDLGD